MKKLSRKALKKKRSKEFVAKFNHKIKNLSEITSRFQLA